MHVPPSEHSEVGALVGGDSGTLDANLGSLARNLTSCCTFRRAVQTFPSSAGDHVPQRLSIDDYMSIRGAVSLRYCCYIWDVRGGDELLSRKWKEVGVVPEQL